MSFEPETLTSVGNGEAASLTALQDRPVAALCGIAHPQAFLETLGRSGARVVSQHIFPDHFQYLPEHFRAVEEKARAEGAEWIVTTEKDAVKFLNFNCSLPMYSLCLAVNIVEGCEAWDQMLESATVRTG